MKPDPVDPERHARVLAELKAMSDMAKAADPSVRIPVEEVMFMSINRTVLRRKGKWKRMPDDS